MSIKILNKNLNIVLLQQSGNVEKIIIRLIVKNYIELENVKLEYEYKDEYED